MFFVPNICGPKFLLDLSHHLHSIHVQNTFLTDSKQIQKILEFFLIKIFLDSKMFLVPNILGPKFLQDLSFDSQNIHVQNTFLTDSKQIQKILENFWDYNIFGPKMFLFPNMFGPKFH